MGIISNAKPAVQTAYQEKVTVDTTPNEEATKDTAGTEVDPVAS